MEGNVLVITIFGFLIALSGKLFGFVISRVTKNVSRRMQGTLMGFTAGVLIAFVCFSILPEAFEKAGVYFVIVGILAGVCLCVFLDGKILGLVVSHGSSVVSHGSAQSSFIKTGLIVAIGVMVHNLPEGIAIGSICAVSMQEGIKLGIVVLIHCIPEAIAVCIPLSKGGYSKSQIFFIIVLISLPMGIGSFIGAYLSGVTQIFLTLSLSFAGGVMLYITCGEILPESKDIWNGRLSTVGALLGFIIGILLTV